MTALHSDPTIAARQRWMGVLARARREELDAHADALRDADYHLLRAAETGMTLVRGRMGGTGSPFNLGEMTVTRCVVRLGDGRTGYSYVAGRDKRHAELAALADAHLQGADAAAWQARLIEPLARTQAERRAAQEAEIATTKVEFRRLMTSASLPSPADTAALLQPAFQDPVLDAQRSFRAALKALAEPGLVRNLDRAPALAALQPASYALCLSFLDSDTPLWLAPGLDSPTLRANLAFHCGCPIVAEREQALFALLDEGELDDLSGFDSGSDRYPDQSCTLLIQLAGLDGGASLEWRGPGIAEVRQVALPVSAGFWAQRAARTEFPRGLDAFFAAGERILGLPRSTRVSEPVEEVA